MKKLDLAVQTLFTEFQESVLARFRLEEDLKNTPSFVKKKIKGKDYWYQQIYVRNKKRQSYFGSSNLQNNQKVIQQREKRKKQKKTIKQMKDAEKRRAAMLKKARLPSADSFTGSILEHLSKEKLIYQNGVLVGSWAFAAYSGIFNALFDQQSLKTLDIDIVRDQFLIVTDQEPLKLENCLPSSGKNFHAIPTLSPKQWSYSFVGPHNIRIDFLTPQRGKPKSIIKAPGLDDVGAQVLPFLDFLIKDALDTVILYPRGGIPVTIPQPSRYAVHKIIVGTRRDSGSLAKQQKDFHQASQLLLVCAKEEPEELKQAYREAVQRGKSWKAGLKKGINFLSDEVKAVLE